MSTCGICERPVREPLRSGGLDICPRCMGGDAARVVAQRGWSIQSRTWDVHTREGTIHHIDSQATLDRSLPLSLTLRPKRGFMAFLGLFLGIKVGDPLFNRTVYATSSTPLPASRFLGLDAVQSAVMDLMGEQVTVHISPVGLRVKGISQHTAYDEARVETELAVLMQHIAAFMGGADGL